MAQGESEYGDGRAWDGNDDGPIAVAAGEKRPYSAGEKRAYSDDDLVLIDGAEAAELSNQSYDEDREITYRSEEPATESYDSEDYSRRDDDSVVDSYWRDAENYGSDSREGLSDDGASGSYDSEGEWSSATFYDDSSYSDDSEDYSSDFSSGAMTILDDNSPLASHWVRTAQEQQNRRNNRDVLLDATDLGSSSQERPSPRARSREGPREQRAESSDGGIEIIEHVINNESESELFFAFPNNLTIPDWTEFEDAIRARRRRERNAPQSAPEAANAASDMAMRYIVVPNFFNNAPPITPARAREYARTRAANVTEEDLTDIYYLPQWGVNKIINSHIIGSLPQETIARIMQPTEWERFVDAEFFPLEYPTIYTGDGTVRKELVTAQFFPPVLRHLKDACKYMSRKKSKEFVGYIVSLASQLSQAEIELLVDLAWDKLVDSNARKPDIVPIITFCYEWACRRRGSFARPKKVYVSTQFKNVMNPRDKTCLVCLDEFKKTSSVISMDCLHVFHSKCATSWLKVSDCCPHCRALPKY
ncbi:hypothetical protein PAPHI01_0871 [Pancytospora philotis]|nr:hypothetical protein PAPHI01_0871 [Pancytospora philotis]